MVLEIEAINRKLQTVEEFSRLVPLEENVVEGEFDQMTDIIINKDFQFKFWCVLVCFGVFYAGCW